MANLGFISKRVKKTPQTGITSDRYEFLGLDQAEPDLGDPLVGPSSIGANPAPLGSSQYVLVALSGNTGKRYWVPSLNLSAGLIPGSFTVYSDNNQIGLANSFNKFNFIGNGVSVDYVGFTPEEQTGIATVRINIVNLPAPGNLYSIPYHSDTGFLGGANNFVYVNGNVGIGSTNPSEILDVGGNVKISGIVTASGGFVGNLTGTASSIRITNDSQNLSRYLILSNTNTNNESSQAVVGDNLVYNLSTNSLGIGTSSPISNLHVVGGIFVSGVTTSFDFNTTSDIQLKTNIRPIENSLEKIIQIRGVTFNWKESNRSSAGVIAQEVESLFPEIVGGEEIKTVNYNGINAILIEAIKELKLENDLLKEKLDKVYKKVFE